MNKFYDKLLLVIALLALLAGVGFYVMKSGEAPSGKPEVSTETANNPYKTIPVASSKSDDATWPEAVEQSTEWVYDVFTPPKIYLMPDGTFGREGVKPPPPPPPFGIYLADVKQDPYRIQVEGYIEEAEGALVLFYDEERKKSVRGRVGDEIADSAFKLIDFNIERIVHPTEGIYKVATAKILDQRENKEMTIKHGERLMKDEVTVIVKSEEDSSVEVILSTEGEAFETPLGQYTLKEINLEESSITVEKQGTEELEAETKVLYATIAEAETTLEEPPTEKTTESESLDFIF
ncbi:MAG: hypothetical protein ACSHYA_13070 [Opitutaceae bacterium]